MNTEELERILAGTRSAAHEASVLVHGGFRRRPAVEHKGVIDLVTTYDRESEALLRERLKAAFGFDIIGEEEGGTWNKTAPAFFIDPIDGTTNFVHGHPFWCVSVGLVVDEQPVLGVVVAPSLGLEWFGYVAEGAEGAEGGRRAVRSVWGDAAEQACAVSPVARFADAMLATGFPYDRQTSAENNFDAFVAIKKRCQAVRRCGSAALDLCLVADGTYEGYWERKLRPWDIAAGIAIVRAAGGRVSEFGSGTSYITSGRVVATNGHIHEALLAELAKV